jgi:hypothetical protein
MVIARAEGCETCSIEAAPDWRGNGEWPKAGAFSEERLTAWVMCRIDAILIALL